MNLIRTDLVRTDPVQSLYKFHTRVDVLRLDLVHPVISGNKWYKLKNYISDAKKLSKKILLSFGGAYSNHIVATAAAAHASGLKSIGIIRGEKPEQISHSLQQAIDIGMDVFYTSRNNYSNKQLPEEVFEKYNEEDCYLIAEGGFGIKGMEGARDILHEVDEPFPYDHIFAATGTGTMLAGLINQSPPNVKTTGITVLKNNFSVENDIRSLLYAPANQPFRIHYDYHRFCLYGEIIFCLK
jgi:1-aminocyclopropane-1-carboxylate deaminase